MGHRAWLLARLHLWGICAAVSVGSQCVVLLLILLVLSIITIGQDDLVIAYSPSNPPEPPVLLYNTPGHAPVHSHRA